MREGEDGVNGKWRRRRRYDQARRTRLSGPSGVGENQSIRASVKACGQAMNRGRHRLPRIHL